MFISQVAQHMQLRKGRVGSVIPVLHDVDDDGKRQCHDVSRPIIIVNSRSKQILRKFRPTEAVL